VNEVASNNSLPLDAMVTFAQACRLLPGKRKPHIGSVHRCAGRGVRGVRLRSIVCAGVRYTCKEWIDTFLLETSGNDLPPNTIPTPARRQREIDCAERELAAVGI